MSQPDTGEDRPTPETQLGPDFDMDCLPDAVVVAVPDTGRLVDANTAAGELFHCRPAELIGCHQSELHPPAHEDAYVDAFERAVDGERVNRLRNGQPLYIETFDDQRVPIEINVSRIERPDGVFVLGVFREVSDQLSRERTLETATSRLETLLNALPVPVTVLDGDSTVTLWNQAAEATFGYSADSVTGRALPLFVEDDEFELLFDRVRDEGSIDGYETAFRVEDGSRVAVELYVHPIYENGAFAGITVAAIDISERQQRERQLDVLHRVLRHNLRNELTVIDGWNQHAVGDTSARREAAAKIDMASDRLLALSEEVKQIRSGLTSDVPKTGPIPVTALVSRLSAQVAARETETTMVTVEEHAAGAIPHRGVQAVSQLFESVLSHVQGVTLELAIQTYEQYLLLELTAPVSLLASGERMLVETGKETALEHGTDLQIARAYLIVESIGGAVTVGTADAPGSELRVELPRTDGRNELA